MKSILSLWGLFAASLAVGCVLLGAPDKASGQEPPAQTTYAKPTDAQTSLNDDGVRAMIEGDYAGAVSLLERSIRLGEINVTYLNLGRAYQKLGRCAKAREALQKAKTAPAVADPPASEVRALADSYLAELDESCEADEKPDGGDAQKDGSDSGAEKGGEVADPGQPVDEGDGANLLGWGMTLSGVALVGGGVALHFVAESNRAAVLDTPEGQTVGGVTQREALQIEEDADQLDTIGLAMGIGGGVAAAVGTYLLLTDDGDDSQGASVWIGPENLGISWTQHF